MKRICAVLLLACMAVSALAETPSWPCWRGPNGDGTSTETGWNPLALDGGAKVLWSMDLSFGYSNVAIKDNRLYALGRTKGYPSQLAFTCLDAATGKTIWRSLFKLNGTPQATPAIDGDRVYGLNGDGTLLCLQAEDGKLVWQKSLESDYNALLPDYQWVASPIIDGNLLLLNANSRALALDKVSGDFVWAIDDARQQSSGIDQDALASVVVADIGGFRCALYAMPTDLRVVDVKTGKILWSFTHALDGSRRDLVVSGERILDPDHDILLEPAGTQLKTLWTSEDGFGAMSSPILQDGYLYGTQWPDDFLSPTGWANFQSGSLPLICMEWSTGRTLWRKDLPYVSATAAGGKLIALELNGTLHIADVTPSGYTELSSADVLGGAKKARTFATPPVLCGGRIYCRNYTGDLVCIDVSR